MRPSKELLVQQVCTAISLRACYAMSGTATAYAAPKAMSGTDLAYATLSAYALATRCPVLTERMPLPEHPERVQRCNGQHPRYATTAFKTPNGGSRPHMRQLVLHNIIPEVRCLCAAMVLYGHSSSFMVLPSAALSRRYGPTALGTKKLAVGATALGTKSAWY
eukprot:616362-Rhodomonas_salina.2